LLVSRERTAASSFTSSRIERVELAQTTPAAVTRLVSRIIAWPALGEFRQHPQIFTIATELDRARSQRNRCPRCTAPYVNDLHRSEVDQTNATHAAHASRST
jgi:hypothetical protein